MEVTPSPDFQGLRGSLDRGLLVPKTTGWDKLVTPCVYLLHTRYHEEVQKEWTTILLLKDQTIRAVVLLMLMCLYFCISVYTTFSLIPQRHPSALARKCVIFFCLGKRDVSDEDTYRRNAKRKKVYWVFSFWLLKYNFQDNILKVILHGDT